MRLIDADAAIDAFDNQTWERLDIPICKGIRNAAKETIRQLPTIDAVPVIRCKDCAKNRTDDCSMHFEDEEKVYEWNEEIDFCSWAERKEE